MNRGNTLVGTFEKVPEGQKGNVGKGVGMLLGKREGSAVGDADGL